MKQKIPSEYVASKLNDWYNAIRKNQIAASESLKAEILNDFQDMEENQDVPATTIRCSNSGIS